MYRREPRHLLSFEEFFLPFGGKLSGDNRWIKLAALIPWDELEDDYAAQFPSATAMRKTSSMDASQAISDGARRLDDQDAPGSHR